MENKILTVKDSLLTGWNLFKVHWLRLLGTLFLIFSFLLTVDYLATKLGSSSFILALRFVAIDLVLGSLISIIFVDYLLKLYDSPLEANLFRSWRPDRLVDYVLTFVATVVIVSIGLLLFIVPGLIAAFYLMLAPWLVIDKNDSPQVAFKKSITLVNKNWRHLTALSAAVFILNMLGVMAFGLGLIITMPVSALAWVHSYRNLKVSEES